MGESLMRGLLHGVFGVAKASREATLIEFEVVHSPEV